MFDTVKANPVQLQNQIWEQAASKAAKCFPERSHAVNLATVIRKGATADKDPARI